MQNTRKLF